MEACCMVAQTVAFPSAATAASASASTSSSFRSSVLSRAHCAATSLPSLGKKRGLREGFQWKLEARRGLVCRASFTGAGALTPEVKESVDKFLKQHKIVLFMKGTKFFPQCGFSNTVVQILNRLDAPYETVNILEDDALRQGLKAYSNWPTFPQLYIDGEFFGGCDITLEAYQSGQLKEVVERAMCS